MSDVVLEMANKLADDCLALQRETGDDRLFMEVAKQIGASSQTLEEAFLTAVRTKLADRAAKQYMARRLAEHRAANPPKNPDGSAQKPVGQTEIIPPGAGGE